MQIAEYFATESEAFEHEKKLIAHYKSIGADLVNLTDGGLGPSGCRFSPESNQSRSEKMTGYKYQIIECPHCGTKGGATSTKRWHFDNCTGSRPQYKARPTVLGKRHYLGKFSAKEIAMSHEQEFKELVIEEYEHLKTLRSQVLMNKE